jgi:hypothetical protein
MMRGGVKWGGGGGCKIIEIGIEIRQDNMFLHIA